MPWFFMNVHLISKGYFKNKIILMTFFCFVLCQLDALFKFEHG